MNKCEHGGNTHTPQGSNEDQGQAPVGAAQVRRRGCSPFWGFLLAPDVFLRFSPSFLSGGLTEEEGGKERRNGKVEVGGHWG